MRKKKRPPDPPIPDAVAHGTEHSPLYRLFHRRHAELAALWKGRRTTWAAVCAWAAEQGAWAGTGEAPKPLTAKKTWERVCAAKAKEAAERQAKQRPARVPTPKANTSPPQPAPPPGQPRPPVSWVVPPAPFAPSHSRPTAGEPTTAPMTEGQRLSQELLEELKRRP